MIVVTYPQGTPLLQVHFTLPQILHEYREICNMVDGNKLVGKPGAYYFALTSARLQHETYKNEKFRHAFLLYPQ